jgi:hypothetical protein
MIEPKLSVGVSSGQVGFNNLGSIRGVSAVLSSCPDLTELCLEGNRCVTRACIVGSRY